ncbi:MAG: PAS domain S-box protein [Deltaproteobacteria bacterium]|nr:PAS domain S-box protein [Deltaproteobacteria bacterium]
MENNLTDFEEEISGLYRVLYEEYEIFSLCRSSSSVQFRYGEFNFPDREKYTGNSSLSSIFELKADNYDLKLISSGDFDIYVAAPSGISIDYRMFLNYLMIMTHRFFIQNENKKYIYGKESTDNTAIELEELKNLIENQGVGISLVDDNENFLFINGEGRKILGISDDNENINLQNFIDEDTKHYLRKQTEKRKCGENGSYEMDILTSDGERKTIHVKAVSSISEKGSFKGTYGTFKDITREANIKRELTQNEAMLKAVLETIPDAVYIKNTEGKYILVNHTVENIFGLTRDELIGKTDKELLGGESAQEKQLSDKEVLKGKKVQYENTEIINGQTLTFETVKLPLKDSDGNTFGICGTSRDITQKKKSREILKAHHDQLMRIFETMDDVVMVIDFDTNEVLFMNEVARGIWGEGCGRKCFEVFQSSKSPCDFCSHKYVRDSSESYTWEYRSKINGRWYKSVDRAINWSDKRRVKCEIATDITENKKIESRYRRKLSMQRVLSEISSGFINANGKDFDENIEVCLHVIAKFMRSESVIFYVHSKEKKKFILRSSWLKPTVESSTLPQTIPHEMVAGIFSSDYHSRNTVVLDKDEPGMSDNPLFRMYPQLKSFALVPLFLKNSLFGVIVFTSRNRRIRMDSDDENLVKRAGEIFVNELYKYQLDQEKLHLEEQLIQSQKLEAIGSLAGGIAHDFNNILTVIMGNMSLLQMDIEEKDPSQETVMEVIEAAQTASTLVSQLLAFSRKQVLNPLNVHVNDIIKETSNIFSRLLGETINIEYELSDDLNNTRVDVSQLKQVLINLAVNARDAMMTSSSGYLLIKTFREKISPVNTVNELPSGDYICISVSDNGSGMDEMTLKRIFEPFFTTKGQGKGTGLGLATSYGIIAQHGGTITVTSTPEKGTTFNVYLPCDNQDSVVVNRLENIQRTALVIEDNPVFREKFFRYLRHMGFTVIFSSSSKEGANVAQRHPETIHLLLTTLTAVMDTRKDVDVIRDIFPGIKVVYRVPDDFPASGGARDFHVLRGDFSRNDFEKLLSEIF